MSILHTHTHGRPLIHRPLPCVFVDRAMFLPGTRNDALGHILTVGCFGRRTYAGGKVIL